MVVWTGEEMGLYLLRLLQLKYSYFLTPIDPGSTTHESLRPGGHGTVICSLELAAGEDSAGKCGVNV